MNSRKATHGGGPSRVRSSIALSSAVLSPCLAAASSALADQPDIADLPTSWAALANDSAMRPSENQKPDFSSDIAARGGHDNIARLDASFTLRIYERHGIALKYLFNRRDAFYPDVGDSTQIRGTIGIFYTFLGHERFGAVDWR
jgi:hypothetical protein